MALELCPRDAREARAGFDFEPQHECELGFVAGELLTALTQSEDHGHGTWVYGAPLLRARARVSALAKPPRVLDATPVPGQWRRHEACPNYCNRGELCVVQFRLLMPCSMEPIAVFCTGLS